MASPSQYGKIRTFLKKQRKGRELKLRILHYNCRGKANKERLYEFEKGLEKINWDSVGLNTQGGGKIINQPE